MNDYDRAFADGKRTAALKSILSRLQRLSSAYRQVVWRQDEMADEIDEIALTLGRYFQSGVQGSGKHPETRGRSEAHPATERSTVCPTASQFGVAFAAGGSPALCKNCGGSGFWDGMFAQHKCIDCGGSGLEPEGL